MLLISSLLVSCGIKDDSKADKEVGKTGEATLDVSDANKEEDSEANTENMLNVVEEKEQVPLQQSLGEGEVASGEDLDKDKDAIRDGEVLTIIQAQYQQDQESGNQGSLFSYPEYLVELDIPGLYEKTQMRAYQAFTSIDNPAGTYLLYNKIALSVLDSFEETCIADIDQNGEYELLSLFGFGSGIYRINLNVYQATNPIIFSSTAKIPMLRYHNCFVPKAGYGKLVFDQVSDSEVHLKEVDLETEQVGKDYGKLVVNQETGRITLGNLEEFPYDVWDDVYNQENWETKDYDYDTLTAIPELDVSVGNTIIHNVSAKMDWNGEKEDTIEFSDAIMGEIPQFSPPSGIYEYDQEIRFEFQEVNPSSIKIMDTLITKEGQSIYSNRLSLERSVRQGEDGAFYLGLENHFALHLSSSIASYSNGSYRGFRVICEFGENRSCEYVFVLSLGPVWKEIKK
jgi:hypothetical protein